jgi:hypothetical protein
MKSVMLCLVMVVVTGRSIDTAGQVQPAERGRSGEWLSWSPTQRSAYVYGFVDGFLGGFGRACDLADERFEASTPHRLGDKDEPGEMPSARCLARRREFSKVERTEAGIDVSAYAGVITEFYGRYESCRDFPFAVLLQSLNNEHLSADQLYEAAMEGHLKGYEIRSREWCSGSVAPTGL